MPNRYAGLIGNMSKRTLLRISIALNLVLLLLLGLLAFKRYRSVQWKDLQQQTMSYLPFEQLILVGDSQLDYLQQMGFLDGYRHLNLAVPGQTTEVLLQRLRTWAVDEKRQQVLLLSGINDLRHGTAVDTLLKLQQEAIHLLRERYPNSELLLLALYPISDGLAVNREADNKKILEFNRQVKTFADTLQITFLSFDDILLRDGRLNPAYSMDGLHLNADGNQLIFQSLSGFIVQE